MSVADVLTVALKEKVAVITLNRARQMNALDTAVMNRLRLEIEKCDADDRVHVVVLTGEGEKAFSAGIDLKERGAMTDDEVADNRLNVVKPCFDAFRMIGKPTIAAVNGVALGGGAELALACDIRLATPTATFAHPEIKWGMIASAGAHQRMRNLVGLGKAKEILLTGRQVSATEAHHLGIYNHLHAQMDLMDATMEMASLISGHSTLAVSQSKRVLDSWAYSDDAFEDEFASSLICFEDGSAVSGPKEFKKGEAHET